MRGEGRTAAGEPDRIVEAGGPGHLTLANRHRKLTLENVEASTPDGEMALIKRYTFRVGASETSLDQ
jgi:hypothetical protein